MRLSKLTRAVVRARSLRYRAPVAFVTLALGGVAWCTSELEAQQWRGRGFTRIEYVEARPFVLDSVPIEATSGSGRQRLAGDLVVTCPPGATFCYFYGAGPVVSTSPVVQDLDVSVWGFGVEGLRAYASARLRTALGDAEFWPRRDDHFDLIVGYVELDRRRFRARVGRDYEISGLGFYGYDGGSLVVRFDRPQAELEAYGGWGLARGVPEPVNSDAFSSLGDFQPLDRNMLFGFRGAARPVRAGAIEAIYQREINTETSKIASERLSFDATYAPMRALWFKGNVDYDLAAGWWGKAGATVGWSPLPPVYIEGRIFRYRPVFSLQTIWVAFSPTPYSGWGVAVGGRPRRDLSVRLELERWDYADTDAEVPFFATTDRTWRAGASASWFATDFLDIQGAYWLNYTVGAALNAGDLELNIHPNDELTIGARFSAFQQLEEFRIKEERVWSLGGDIRWVTYLGTLWGALEHYQHNLREDPALPDWSQVRGYFGLSFYVGSEPGRSH